MQIPRPMLDGYLHVLNAQSDAARAEAFEEVSNIIELWDGKDIAKLRYETINALDGILEPATDGAAALAADFYDHIRDMQGIESRYSAEAVSCRNARATGGAVRAFVENVRETGDTDKFLNNVLSRVDYEVRRSALECTKRNSDRDPAKPRYGRVPSGTETCGFCLMLASFGFNCNSVEAASHTHEHCDCLIVSNYGNASVQGYHPDVMDGNRKKCLEAIGGEKQLHKDWLALPEEERRRLIERRGGMSEAKRSYYEKRISKEIETRDAEWFKTGKVPKVRTQQGAEPDEWEREVGELLSKNGIPIVFQKRSLKIHDRRADTIASGVKCEIKNPTGSSILCVHNQVKKNLYGSSKKPVLNPQSSHVVISNVRSDLTFEELVSQVEPVLKGDTGFSETELACISEVVILDKDGRIRRIKR